MPGCKPSNCSAPLSRLPTGCWLISTSAAATLASTAIEPSDAAGLAVPAMRLIKRCARVVSAPLVVSRRGMVSSTPRTIELVLASNRLMRNAKS